MSEQLTVILEGKEFKVTVPLTLGQVQDCRVAVVLASSDDPQEEARRDYKRGVDIILAAMAAENPDFNAAKLAGMRISRQEFNKAVGDILDASGLVPSKKDGAQGEATAEAVAA